MWQLHVAERFADLHSWAYLLTLVNLREFFFIAQVNISNGNIRIVCTNITWENFMQNFSFKYAITTILKMHSCLTNTFMVNRHHIL